MQFYVRTGGVAAKTMTYAESRAKYADTLDAVVDDLLRSPENLRRLMASINRLEHGEGVEQVRTE